MLKRKICVVTGTRADYGLLYCLMKKIDDDPELELQLVVTGAHLSPDFGLTYKVIEADGFAIDVKVDMLLSSDSFVGIAKSMGLGTIGFAEAFDRLEPDIVVILGDRYEMLSAAQVALVARIPIAHIHGGEITEGAFDDSIRHAITKMASLHFTSTELYRKRVIQMGEQPDCVFNVGAPGLDNVKRLSLLDREAFERSIEFGLGDVSFLVTCHPETLSDGDPERIVDELFFALGNFPEAHVIFTGANADPGGSAINRKLKEYAETHPENARFFLSLGQVRYLSALRHVDVIIGNSSSGILEVPSFKKATVNIGDRQKGRLRAISVIDCAWNGKEIAAAIDKALSSDFQCKLKKMKSPYGSGGASEKIKKVLKGHALEGLSRKRFYDLGS